MCPGVKCKRGITSARVTFQAVLQGILDRRLGEYVNPGTGEAVAIQTAMSDGRIVVDHVTTTRTPEKCLSIGIMTIRTQIDTHEYAIAAAMDTGAGQLLSVDEVRRHHYVITKLTNK